jgi:hypothetical protein
MTAAAEMPRTPPASDLRERISAAVNRVDVIQIDADLGRMFLHWLGGYAKLAQARYGCLPEGLADATYALAEAVADHGDSHRASFEAIPAPLVSDLVEVRHAAAVLGVKPTTVRWHYRSGNLSGRKVGETLMIDSDSLEQLRARREGMSV